VILSTSVSPTGPTVGLSSSSISLGPGGSGSSTLTISSSSATGPGVYTVTVSGSMGSQTHSLTLRVTVTSSINQIFGLPSAEFYGISGGAIALVAIGVTASLILSRRGQKAGQPALKPASKLCPSCAAQQDPSSMFCDNCGTRLP
jgi:hypothetical protein